MSTVVTARVARADSGAFRYQRHQPEKTLLYQLVLKHYPDFRRQLAEEGRVLPDYVQREFEDYLKCGRLEHGFLRVRCETCHEERLVAFSCTNSRRFRRAPRFLPQLRCAPHGREFSLIYTEVVLSEDQAYQMVRLITHDNVEVHFTFRLGLQVGGEYKGMWMTEAVWPLHLSVEGLNV